MFRVMKAPRQLVIYADLRYSWEAFRRPIWDPSRASYTAEWIAARLAGMPFASERWFVEPTGRVAKSPAGVSIALGWTRTLHRAGVPHYENPTPHHFGAALKVPICSITGFHSACSVRM